jgi:hypothetical protein
MGFNRPMKTIFILAVLVLSTSAFARQTIALPVVNFSVSTDHALSKFDQMISNPERVLQRYRPVGVKIKNKNVAGNEISFTAVKTVLMISKSVYVHGVLDTRETGKGCGANERAYSLRMRFESSDRLVTDNVDELRAVLCLRENSESKVSGRIQPALLTGDRYSRTLGPLAVGLIKDQVSPLLSALTEEIKAMR